MPETMLLAKLGLVSLTTKEAVRMKSHFKRLRVSPAFVVVCPNTGNEELEAVG